MSDVQKIIHSKIVKDSNYGVDDDYTQGFIDGLSYSLHRVVEHDGVNRTCCKEFDIKGGIGMSASKYTDWLSIPIPVTVYSFTCDAVGCHGSCELAVSDDTDELVRVNDEESTFDMPVIDMDDAREYLLFECGWEEGTQGVQRDHLYCPKHAEQVA